MEIIFILIGFIGVFGLPFWINLYGRLKGNKPTTSEENVDKSDNKR